MIHFDSAKQVLRATQYMPAVYRQQDGVVWVNQEKGQKVLVVVIGSDGHRVAVSPSERTLVDQASGKEKPYQVKTVISSEKGPLEPVFFDMTPLKWAITTPFGHWGI